MKVSLEWLQSLIDIDQSAAELAEVLTRGGIEVGGVETANSELEAIVIGEITSLEQHPNAEKLWISKVNTGSEELTLVTGAQNLLVGDRVSVARVGTILPNGLLIEASKFRGVTSEGMLCSAEELQLDKSFGLERSTGGILILPADAPIGNKLSDYLQGDSVLDLELYPNRPDCLAMVNVAREVSFLTGASLSLPKWAELTNELRDELALPVPANLDIIIEEPDLSWRYAGLVVEDVKIEPSPEWMQKRLKAAGVRPISNIVDITNYCMLEMGQPLHAFDFDKIEGSVHVRRANKGERLVTLDGAERELDTDMLLIADDKQALGLAGVMGGLDSEITQNTTRLLIEAAHFAGVSIRRTSRKLGLRSEASNRFEKGINPYGVVATLGRVIDLLKELGAGRPVALLDRCGYLPPLRQIEISAERTSEVLGMDIAGEEIESVLKRLNFAYEQENGLYRVQVPSYRLDLQIEEDMIEEVARLIGYERIPTTLPHGDQTQGRRSPEQEFRRRL
ncbi:MAG: phenylalanine--tRNA ligase subunit beta, partial [Desulfitobacterium hafniense]|nr:phenylalanine--tRNA ligase subunit beta [Desulfitobacterium hafniense]